MSAWLGNIPPEAVDIGLGVLYVVIGFYFARNVSSTRNDETIEPDRFFQGEQWIPQVPSGPNCQNCGAPHEPGACSYCGTPR